MTAEQQATTLPQPAAPRDLTGSPPAATAPVLDVAAVHLRGVTGRIYAGILETIFPKGDPAAKTAPGFIREIWERFQPRDGAEELLVSQMIQTQIRVVSLTTGAQGQKNLAWAKMMYEAADRASNTFRRQMLALSEYRNPKKAGAVTTIEQANIAHQQVVQNHPPAGKKNATNEKGWTAQEAAGQEVGTGHETGQ